jgi:hypothetical protein
VARVELSTEVPVSVLDFAVSSGPPVAKSVPVDVSEADTDTVIWIASADVEESMPLRASWTVSVARAVSLLAVVAISV